MKLRADQLLVSRGLAESRTRAQALIMAGAVFRGEKKLSKAGDMLAEDAALEVRGKDHPWVSRGGIKLDHGLTHFGFDVAGAVALDVGSSTGGFTDVLLAGARPRSMRSMSAPTSWRGSCGRTRASSSTSRPMPARSTQHHPRAGRYRRLRCELHRPRQGARSAAEAGKAGAKLVALIKPQFEAGREEVGKGGVVRDPAVHERVCAEAKAWVESQGWTVLGVTPSPITGPEGNVEFLLGAEKNG